MNVSERMMLNIDFSERPNSEDPAVMSTYAQIQRTLYQQQPTIEHYLEFWLALSPNKQVIDGVMGHVKEMLYNDDHQERIRHIYDHVLGLTSGA